MATIRRLLLRAWIRNGRTTTGLTDRVATSFVTAIKGDVIVGADVTRATDISVNANSAFALFTATNEIQADDTITLGALDTVSIGTGNCVAGARGLKVAILDEVKCRVENTTMIPKGDGWNAHRGQTLVVLGGLCFSNEADDEDGRRKLHGPCADLVDEIVRASQCARSARAKKISSRPKKIAFSKFSERKDFGHHASK